MLFFLVIFSVNRREVNGELVDELIFVQNRDPTWPEMWNGKRLGIRWVTAGIGISN